MKNLLDNIDEVLLMGPGPSCVPDEVYRALSCKTLGHMDYYFIVCFKNCSKPKIVLLLQFQEQVLQGWRPVL